MAQKLLTRQKLASTELLLIHMCIVSRNAQHKDVSRRTIKILQCARIYRANYCSKFHTAYRSFLDKVLIDGLLSL